MLVVPPVLVPPVLVVPPVVIIDLLSTYSIEATVVGTVSEVTEKDTVSFSTVSAESLHLCKCIHTLVNLYVSCVYVGQHQAATIGCPELPLNQPAIIDN